MEKCIVKKGSYALAIALLVPVCASAEDTVSTVTKTVETAVVKSVTATPVIPVGPVIKPTVSLLSKSRAFLNNVGTKVSNIQSKIARYMPARLNSALAKGLAVLQNNKGKIAIVAALGTVAVVGLVVAWKYFKKNPTAKKKHFQHHTKTGNKKPIITSTKTDADKQPPATESAATTSATTN